MRYEKPFHGPNFNLVPTAMQLHLSLSGSIMLETGLFSPGLVLV